MLDVKSNLDLGCTSWRPLEHVLSIDNSRIISLVRSLARNTQRRPPVNYVLRVTFYPFRERESLHTNHISALSELFEIGWRLFNSASFTFQISAGFPPLCMMFNLTFPFQMSVLNCIPPSPSYRGQWWLGLSKPDGHWAEGGKSYHFNVRCPKAETWANTTFIAERKMIAILCFWWANQNAHFCLLTLDLSFTTAWIFAKHSWSVCYSEWRESWGEHWARVEEEWKSTPSLEMRKVAKTATGLNSYGAWERTHLTRELWTNDARVLEGETFPPWGHEGYPEFWEHKSDILTWASIPCCAEQDLFISGSMIIVFCFKGKM